MVFPLFFQQKGAFFFLGVLERSDTFWTPVAKFTPFFQSCLSAKVSYDLILHLTSACDVFVM
jgi:hypothetical protein